MTTNSSAVNGILPSTGSAVDVTVEKDTSTAQAQTVSADEIALYDRQIRLWGVQAQQKLRTASILLITIKALANEVAKNLVLAGIGSLTIQDSELVTEDDLCSQFFVSEDDVGKNRAEAAAPHIQELNPRVSLKVITSDIRTASPEFFTPFDVIIATDLPSAVLTSINDAARNAKRPFYAAISHGMYGFVFADLISHDYVIERDKPNIPTALKAESATRSVIGATTKKENGRTIEMVTKRELYSPLSLASKASLPAEYLTNSRKLRSVTPLLSCFRALWELQDRTGQAVPDLFSHPNVQRFTTIATEKHQELQLPATTLRSEFLRSFMQNCGSEIAPVTAFVGGVLAQDVINALARREQPLQNMLFFDGDEFKGQKYALHPTAPAETL